ncbi:RlpA-like double-psi beta-barrel-protein domain-containing protein-containing protein [Boletus edulis BED1]|uniref:RlpA-like double-psi beta-barrel-protein domain-containing protein-containing protein n=1 Tax=Boletus edulis BED1 TaxID=1328754 RepID=A0AAD4GFB3_BOLED|nr:RlpA-like double-psi beta-barrel-protein domain-containing protein-containing protein [Boletus edulis BED1]
MSCAIDLSSIYSRILSFLVFLSFLPTTQAWIQYPPSGHATMTHYSLPTGFIAACGCTPNSTYYPTAALSQMAYGSSTSYGPACGQCFELTLLDAFTANPRFYPNTTQSVVVKITDLCPLSKSGWCNATSSGPNAGGGYLNFDLAWPSTSIPNSFFPSDATLYGFTDFGVWNVSYQSVSCQEWQGYTNQTALGSVADLGYTSCCPNNPVLLNPLRTVHPNLTNHAAGR